MKKDLEMFKRILLYNWKMIVFNIILIGSLVIANKCLSNPMEDSRHALNDYPLLDMIGLEKDDRGYYISYYNSFSSTRFDAEFFLDDGTRVLVNIDTNVGERGAEKITVTVESTDYMVWPVDPQYVYDGQGTEIRILPPMM